jgi:hypothetical protein
MHATSFRRDARTVHDEALDKYPDEAPDVFERLSEHRTKQDRSRLFAHDADASAYIEKLGEGYKRAEIAKALGWTVQRAKVVRKRIARTLAAHEAAMNDNGEAEPPSSGPRGNDHVQTAEERRGAPPERHRGARGAGRRR